MVLVTGEITARSSIPLWRGGPDTRTLPAILLTLPPSKAANMALLCVPQNQALGVCRGFVPDIQVCSTHGREDLVNATITSNAEKEELSICGGRVIFTILSVDEGVLWVFFFLAFAVYTIKAARETNDVVFSSSCLQL